MAEPKGLSKPVKLKSDLASFLEQPNFHGPKLPKSFGTTLSPTSCKPVTENGSPENAGKFIVADAKLLTIFRNTHTTGKTGKVTDLTNLKEGETINMMQMASVVGANIE